MTIRQTLAGRDWLRVCDSDALLEGGDGRRQFDAPAHAGGEPLAVFVVRYDGKPCGWVNRCAHVGIELDWMPGKFFDASGLYLICAMHGATYEPDTGRCVAGPCRGQALEPVPVREHDGAVWVAAQG